MKLKGKSYGYLKSEINKDGTKYNYILLNKKFQNLSNKLTKSIELSIKHKKNYFDIPIKYNNKPFDFDLKISKRYQNKYNEIKIIKPVSNKIGLHISIDPSINIINDDEIELEMEHIEIFDVDIMKTRIASNFSPKDKTIHNIKWFVIKVNIPDKFKINEKPHISIATLSGIRNKKL